MRDPRPIDQPDSPTTTLAECDDCGEIYDTFNGGACPCMTSCPLCGDRFPTDYELSEDVGGERSCPCCHAEEYLCSVSLWQFGSFTALDNLKKYTRELVREAMRRGIEIEPVQFAKCVLVGFHVGNRKDTK